MGVLVLPSFGFQANMSRSADVIEIEEPCTHEVQFGGMCGDCGKDMTEYVYPSMDWVEKTMY